jgi:hypothetical protein
LIIIVLSVVNWPDRLTGRKEKETDPKVFRQRVLPRHDYDGKLPLSQAARFLKPREKGCFTPMVFSGFMMRPIFSPQSFGLS